MSGPDKDAIVAAYVAGERVQAIMDEYGTNPAQLYQFLREAGTPQRRSHTPARDRAVCCVDCLPDFVAVYAKNLCQRHYHRHRAAELRSQRPERPPYENVLDRNGGTVLAAWAAGASLRSLGAFYGLTRQSVKNWLGKAGAPPSAAGSGHHRPRWADGRHLDLRDVRDLADWVANFELDARAVELWEGEGGR